MENSKVRRISKKDGIRTYSNDTDLVDSKRKEIINESTKVFVKKGYHQTNMRELSSAIGMSVGSIYHYVGSKQDILYLIINEAVIRPDDWISNIVSNLETSTATTVLKEFIHSYYTASTRHRIQHYLHTRKPRTWTANHKKLSWMLRQRTWKPAQLSFAKVSKTVNSK
jgi:AcrR family transcriptional regulator